MAYTVKEMHYTLQGEGARAGRPVVLVRFVGCNLWTGREGDRSTACCRFCDTDFLGTDGPGGGRFSDASILARSVADFWPDRRADPYVVLTGGEPLLQVDSSLIAALHQEGFEVGVETNGTLACPGEIDWVCVSPKAGSPLRLTCGQELKVVWPQAIDLEMLADLDFQHYWLQPMDGPDLRLNTRLAAERCLLSGPWRLSIQTHKVVGIP